MRKIGMEKIRTRFAPSPTGSMHIGNLRTALYAYALAKNKKGRFILRIEDTDKKREERGGIEKIKETLKTFSLDWDEYYIQSERLKLYQEAAKKLVDKGFAFYCQCKGKNPDNKGYSVVLRDPCREKNLTKGAVKLKILGNKQVSFVDFVLGREISWMTDDLADTTLLKSDGFPTYHLAVVVDDYQMKISHVLRGHDWMPSTPIHLLLYEHLNYQLPEIGHLTDILDPKGGKLSKRKGFTSCEGLLEEGYLPAAILNFIMLLGWAPKDDQEFFSLREFVKKFDIKGLQRANPIFNQDKLNWFNGEYIRRTSYLELVDQFKSRNKAYAKLDGGKQLAVAKLVRERIKTLKDFDLLASFFFSPVKVDKALFGKNYLDHLKTAKEALRTVAWNLEKINPCLKKVIEGNQFNTGDFYMDLRIAITGSRYTPPINESMVILGKEETLKRLEACL